jgi:D-alanyl-D-alanine carboxypeptidase
MSTKNIKIEILAMWAIVLSSTVLVVIGGFSFYRYLTDITENTADFEKKVLGLEEEKSLLSRNLEAERQRNSEFEGQIKEIAGTVGTLDKLAKTDKELLQKYSKVYFLNEHYVPDALLVIPKDFIANKNKELYFHAKVFPFLEDLFRAAQKDGIDIKILSAYRSFGEQVSIKSNYTVVYGSGANRFSADQGYSEHQLGTTVDFTSSENGLVLAGFSDTSAYKWLSDNAYKYGFVLSYPENNDYYQFEPWHWRFVGTNLARRLHEDNMNFYSLDQPTIDNYLISFFDRR